ncbi:TetR family transcriptional regulator [Leekyejoonella antrihumi]|uniref:TetR family transcriptional regulator n=1 Tax=Leekyejoonella antrihumi TaxID=1660198 RepID=A0A563DWK5_9MICO|nr:TetR family transcriptional regulator [Leekyejoonella antrihumi]TWP34597.1 TetR family transcriptional regulator [Leekyejoonella antrihumi]
MGRWEPNAAGRLREAAMDLYVERGFEQTTVAEIAERAGLTARTFFRYFSDKREVLFGGSVELQEHLVQALAAAPDGAPPMEAVAAALDAAAVLLGDNRKFSQRRQSVIAANVELQERELMKMASLSVAFADGLRRRGASDVDARLTAEAGVAIFRVAFERWVSEPGVKALLQVVRDSVDQLKALTAE